MAFLLIAAVPTACGGGLKPAASLAGACQLSAGACVDSNALFWQAAKTVDVQWRGNGDADCPEGYELRRTEKPKPAQP